MTTKTKVINKKEYQLEKTYGTMVFATNAAKRLRASGFNARVVDRFSVYFRKK